MGFYSYECFGCGLSIRHPGACRGKCRWMSKAVYLDSDGKRMKGGYNGYGQIDGGERLLDFESFPDYGKKFALWHQACYRLLGEPRYTAPSSNATDQGHFVGSFCPREPTSIEDFANLRAKVERPSAVGSSTPSVRRAGKRPRSYSGGAKKHSRRSPKAAPVHTATCTDLSRRALREELDDLYMPDFKQGRWRLMSVDAGERLPSPMSIRKESWGPWQNAVDAQIKNASPAQIAAYWKAGHKHCFCDLKKP